jgi:hypothetical protein
LYAAKPLLDLDVRTNATFPYFFIVNSTTPPTSAKTLFAAKETSVFPPGRFLIPDAAIAGVVARAATAAPPQINCLLESAITYLSPDLFIWPAHYFTIDYEGISYLSGSEVDSRGITPVAFGV